MSTAGRVCPLNYRTRPQDFNPGQAAHTVHAETLYVVGGLYGNRFALNTVEALFDAEPTQPPAKKLVFNGDFHWFDAEPQWFSEIQTRVLKHLATRGNVETEIANPHYDEAVGCGCGYPDWVGQEIVDRSNRILGRLRQQASLEQAQALAALPMGMVAEVGQCHFGIIHGDPSSLAGWGFAREHLLCPNEGHRHRQQALAWFQEAGPELLGFACTHTCTPLFLKLASATCAQPMDMADTKRNGTGSRLVLNNGSAGMPNLSNDTAGLLTRISVHPPIGAVAQAVRFGMEYAGLHIHAVGIEYPQASWLELFDEHWPTGSDAALSYRDRIAHSLALSPAEMVLDKDA